MNLRTRLITKKRDEALAAPANSRKAIGWLRLYEWPLLLWLTALWAMLWQEISLLSVVSGLIVAIVVTRLFFLPPVELAGRFNPWAALKYLVYFGWELMLGSFHVAFLALNPGVKVRPAIVAVNLKTHSDFILTMTSLTVSLIPGSLIVDVDRFGSVIYLHVLNAASDEAKNKVRADVLKIERLLVSAIGSRQEMEACGAA